MKKKYAGMFKSAPTEIAGQQKKSMISARTVHVLEMDVMAWWTFGLLRRRSSKARVSWW